MKRITNLKPYKYDAAGHSIYPMASSVFEDEVALEFMKYFPTVLKMEDYVEPVSVPIIPVPTVEASVADYPTAKVSKTPKVAKKVEKISVKTKKRGRPKKSKK